MGASGGGQPHHVGLADPPLQPKPSRAKHPGQKPPWDRIAQIRAA